MGRILKVTAYANNEIAVIAWQLDGMIDDCLGFEITRIYLSGPNQGTEKVLPAWVAFKGQRNPKWTMLTTSTWPVQKLIWRDLTLRKHRADLERNPENIDVRYRVRPLLSKGPANMRVPAEAPPGSYDGNPVDLYYQDPGVESNTVHISCVYSDQLTAAFTNGILSTQWLSHTLEDLKTSGTEAFKAVAKAKKAGATKSQQTVSGIIALISDQNSPVRAYLGGDVPGVLRTLPDLARETAGSWLNMALYELNDKELLGVIKDNAKVTDLILSNTSLSKSTKTWDGENQPARKMLRPVLSSLQDRMFNNSGHIGHNKFVVLSNPRKKPQAVLTGSTNWTPNGLCAQSNNAVIIKSPELAQQYLDYWNDLSADNKNFKTPRPLTAMTNNVQGSTLRRNDERPLPMITLHDGTSIQFWRSPNMQKTTLGTDLPPDLAQVYSLMRRATEAILFAVYLPSGGGLHSVIEEAVEMGMKDPSLLVYGTISDPMAMWTGKGVVPKTKKGAKAKAAGAKKPPPSPIFEQGNVHVVLAQALDKLDATGDFEAEMLKAGFAIIHDKIVVIDPLSDNAAVVMGSHNFGYKASYCNDDNLLIIRNNKRLAQAYCTHIVDLYEHYRFRAVESGIQAKGGTLWDGFLSVNSAWLQAALEAKGKTIAQYLAG